jgi:uncharacterized membrane protein
MKNISKKTSTAILCCTLITALLLSILTIHSPAPKNKAGWFSADRGYNHLEVIAKKQHSVFNLNEIEGVRNYLEETIDAFSNVTWERVKHSPIEVFNQKTQAKEWIDIDNIYAEIPGASGTYMLLMTHYDSCPYKEKYGVATDGSYGAADDGYGMATMLEIMRLMNDYAAGNKLVNGIKFVFTDAEEVALGGAKALVKEYAHWLKDVNIVLNLEARGNKGPLYMFQTSDKNSKLIEFYSSTRLPFSFSIAAEVYKNLPSDTDFTPFLREGYTGLNFSTLNCLKYYHTPEDNLENADKATLQFYGEQIFPLVKKYTGNEKYSAPDSFVSNSNAVFFSLLPGLLVFYSETVSWVLTVIAILCAIVVAYFAIRRKAMSWKKSLAAFGIWLGFILVSAIAGFFLAKFIGLVTGNRFDLMYMPYVPFDLGFTVIFAALVLVAGVFVAKLCRKLNCGLNDTMGGAILLMLVLNSLFAFVLHGGTYLFVWPAIFMMGIVALNLLCCSKKGWLGHVLHVLAILVISIMYLTLIYSLFLALSFGALAVVLLFAGLYGCAVVPCGLSQIGGLCSSTNNKDEKNE